MSVGLTNRMGSMAVGTAVLGAFAFAGQEAPPPRAKVIQINPVATDSAPLLGGPPETVTMRSGSVVLLPSKNVGEHSTGDYEEALVGFSGSGEMRMANGTILNLQPSLSRIAPPTPSTMSSTQEASHFGMSTWSHGLDKDA